MLSLLGLSISRDLIKALAVPALIAGVFAGGWGSGIAWEHRGPQKFPLSILGSSLKVQRDKALAEIPVAETRGRAAGAKAQADVDRPAFARWSARVEQCETTRRSERDVAALAISRAEARLSDQAASAYRLGLAACGVPDATTSSDPGGAGAGGLRDDRGDAPSFRDLFAAGAYRPSDPVSGDRGR